MGRDNKVIQSIEIIIFATILFLYNGLIIIGFIVLIPILPLLVLFKPRSRSLLEKIRIVSPNEKILVHGASVGEHNGTLPLKKYFKNIAFSVNTGTGCNKLKNNRVKCYFMPHDIPFLVYNFLKHIKILIIAESEFLPNTILLAYLMRKKIVLINGRISEKRLFFYKILKPFYKVLFSFFTYVFIANKIEEKKFSLFTDKAINMGNLKYDYLTLKNKQDNKFILLASSHIDDERILKETLRKLTLDLPIVIAPRHIERVNEVIKYYENIKNIAIYSGINNIKKNTIYIVDKMGIMQELYANSLLTIMGGTFCKNIGGHNPLEAIEYKNQIVFGPYIYNFLLEYKEILYNNVGYMVDNSEQLKDIIMNMRKSEKIEKFNTIINTFRPNIKKIIKNIYRIYY